MLGLAGAKIDTCPSLMPVSTDLRDAAAALLADLFTVGLRRGITPANWAVAHLPTSCLDACRQRSVATAIREGTPPRGELTRPTSTELGSAIFMRDRSQGRRRGE